jgi:hypothetical protein
MRSRNGCASFGFILLLCSAAGAEGPAAVVPEPAVAAPATLGPALVAPENPAPTGWLATHLLIGQQIGFRGQAGFPVQGPCTVVAEGFYGLLLTKLGSSESAGGGCRALFCRPSADGRNTLVLGPGVNVGRCHASRRRRIRAGTRWCWGRASMCSRSSRTTGC